MTIRYRAYGREIERVGQGERAAELLALLAAKPWQTRAELKVIPSPTLHRMLAKGSIQRRRRAAKWKPYEYALPGAAPELAAGAPDGSQVGAHCKSNHGSI